MVVDNQGRLVRNQKRYYSKQQYQPVTIVGPQRKDNPKDKYGVIGFRKDFTKAFVKIVRSTKGGK